MKVDKTRPASVDTLEYVSKPGKHQLLLWPLGPLAQEKLIHPHTYIIVTRYYNELFRP
jgi:hypothetical protein